MFVVLTKSDCDIKYIIFKVKNSGFDPHPPLSIPPPHPGCSVWGKTENYLLISVGETGTHAQEGGRPGERPGAGHLERRPPHLPGSALHRQVPTLPKPRRPPACGPFTPEGLGPLPAPPDPPNVQVPPSTGTQRGWRLPARGARQPPLAARGWRRAQPRPLAHRVAPASEGLTAAPLGRGLARAQALPPAPLSPPPLPGGVGVGAQNFPDPASEQPLRLPPGERGRPYPRRMEALMAQR
uniref:Uncharacterized protein n=1 Tax=Myotis myotis TaxID=51298 RepID=A0A7J7T6E5_MYOMY|nr:hypothetical protein mMyoMyo1_009119 [Myotis myotis]